MLTQFWKYQTIFKKYHRIWNLNFCQIVQVYQTGNEYLGFFKQFVAYQLQINQNATDHCLLFKNCAEPQLPDSGLIFLEPFRSSLIPLDDARCSNNRELFPAEFELANAQIQFWSKLVMSKIKLIMQILPRVPRSQKVNGNANIRPHHLEKRMQIKIPRVLNCQKMLINVDDDRDGRGLIYVINFPS